MSANPRPHDAPAVAVSLPTDEQLVLKVIPLPIDPGTMAQMDKASAAVAARFGQSPGPLSALERGC